jgi:hypothetical protein
MCPGDRCTQVQKKKQLRDHEQFCNNQQQNLGIQIRKGVFWCPAMGPTDLRGAKFLLR